MGRFIYLFLFADLTPVITYPDRHYIPIDSNFYKPHKLADQIAIIVCDI